MIDFAKLAAPFPPDRISWRVGSTTQDKKRGMALAYLDARDVMVRLDEVCTPGGWQCHYPHAGAKTVCEIGIKVGEEWVWKADGAGDTDIEAEKGALSDSFKRAAVKWGIGRYLYDMDSPWVELEPMGKSYKIADDAMAKLRGGRTPTPVTPAAARPPVPPTTAVGGINTGQIANGPPPSDWDTVVNDIIGEIAKTKTGADLAALYGDHQQRMAKAPAEMKQRVLAIGKRHHEDLMRQFPAMASG